MTCEPKALNAPPLNEALRTLEQAGERAWVAGRLVEGDGVILR